MRNPLLVGIAFSVAGRPSTDYYDDIQYVILFLGAAAAGDPKAYLTAALPELSARPVGAALGDLLPGAWVKSRTASHRHVG